MQSAIYYDTRIFKERVKTSWGRDSMLLKDLLGSRHHHRIYMNKPNNLKKRVSMPFRAYTKGWCYWKTYPNLRRRIGLKWENLFEKRGFNAFSGLHEGLVLLKDLSEPSTPNRTYMMKIIWKWGFNAFSGLHEGLVLLKDLSKPSTPNRTYMRKSI